MPYSQYVVKDRQAIGQLSYQLRRFAKQMKTAGVAPEDQNRINEAFQYAFGLAKESQDFDDEGSRIYYGERERLPVPLKKCCERFPDCMCGMGADGL